MSSIDIPVNTKAELFQKLRGNEHIVIYGAGYIGQLLFKECRELNLSVICFADDDTDIIGTEICGVKVLQTQEAAKQYPFANYLISMRVYIPYAYKLQSVGIRNIFGGGILFEDFDFKTFKKDGIMAKSFARILYCHEVHKYVPSKEEHFLIPDCLIHVITDICNLKCRNCNQFLPYLTHKKGDVPAEKILYELKTLLRYVDYFPLYDFMGGETFMHKELNIILKEALKEKKIGRIQLATNGTLLPQPKLAEVLSDDRISLLISDYGKASTQLDLLCDFCEKNGIDYFVASWKDWGLCSYPKKHNRSSEEHLQNFNNCSSRFRTNYHNGKLYRCGSQVYAYDRINEVPNIAEDYIDIQKMNRDGLEIDLVKNKIFEYLTSQSPLKLCDYCTLGQCDTVPPGEQKKRCYDKN